MDLVKGGMRGGGEGEGVPLEERDARDVEKNLTSEEKEASEEGGWSKHKGVCKTQVAEKGGDTQSVA